MKHEYALLGGYNRTHVGRWLGMLAALISSLLVFVLLTAVDVGKQLGIDANLPPMALSLVGAGAVYGVLYLTFNHVIWRYGPLSRVLGVPYLGGVWRCDGQRLEVIPAQPWSGKLTIAQCWDRLQIRLETDGSISDSVAAALQHDPAGGYRLMYHYKNQPRIQAQELSPHHGFAELTFAADHRSATGEYFNGRGRNSFGTMNLTKETP